MLEKISKKIKFELPKRKNKKINLENNGICNI